MLFLKFPYVSQEEKEHTKAFHEMEEKLMVAAFYKLVSLCFTLYFNNYLSRTLLIYILDIIQCPDFY
jgi:hypothetical protein